MIFVADPQLLSFSRISLLPAVPRKVVQSSLDAHEGLCLSSGGQYECMTDNIRPGLGVTN